MRRIRVLVAVATLVISVAPFAAPAGASSACDAVTPLGHWEEIRVTGFPEGPGILAGYSVNPRRPSELWATNGKSVLRSLDGGCSWKSAFTLELIPDLEVPLSSALANIDQIVIPERDPSTVFLVVENLKPEGQSQNVIGPDVVVSRDDGATWEMADTGLPPVSGQALRLRAAPSDANRLYLLLAGPAGGLYGSDNGGRTWDRRNDAVGADIHVDPLDPNDVWAVGGGLRRSLDGGRSFSGVDAVSSSAGFADVFHAPGAPAQITVYEAEGPVISQSVDGGRVWSRFASPLQFGQAMAHGNRPEDVLLSTHMGVWRFQEPYFWYEITPGEIGGDRPEDYEPVLDLQVDRTAEPSVFGFRPSGTIVRYTRLNVELPPIQPSAPSDPGDVLFTPDLEKIKLGPGQSETVRYKLDLPPQPQPLDVFFLVDTSDSMEHVIQGLQEGIHDIAAELSAARIPVMFGLGEFKDYPLAGYGDPIQGDFPYRLDRKIGPADASLISAIESMTASGGGQFHLPESQLTALYQSATGEGDPGFVPPGQDAGFRSDALKVIVHMTDAAFDDSPAHPSPDFDKVSKELKAQGILQIGLAVFGKQGNAQAMNWLTAMADATDTVAPEGGVECGNGTFIGAGDPLVCPITHYEETGAAKIAPAIVATLRAVTEEAPVGLAVTKGADIVAEISPEEYPAVNVKQRNTVTFDVTYKCPALSATSKTPVELVASLRDVGIASAEALVVCGPTDVVKDKVIAPPPVPPVVELAPVAVPVVPAPPAPPAPVANAQPNPNPNPQGAAATQEQEQPQVAMVTEGLSDVEEQELAFSYYEERPQPGVHLLYMSALVMTAAAGFALRLRQAKQNSTIRR